MIRLTLPVVICGLCLSLLGCKESEGSTATSSVTSSIRAFDSVSVSHVCKITIQKQADYSIAITVSEHSKPYLKVEKTGSNLHIGFRPGVRQRGLRCHGTVGMPSFKGLTVSGAASIDTIGFDVLADVTLTSSGAGRLQHKGKIKGLRLQTSGASRVTLQGAAQHMSTSCSGAGRLSLGKFATQSAKIQLSGACKASIQVSKQLKAMLSGVSRLSYAGNPSVEQSTSGVSSISKL